MDKPKTYSVRVFYKGHPVGHRFGVSFYSFEQAKQYANKMEKRSSIVCKMLDESDEVVGGFFWRDEIKWFS